MIRAAPHLANVSAATRQELIDCCVPFVRVAALDLANGQNSVGQAIALLNIKTV
jgi:hypothetical protein